MRVLITGARGFVGRNLAESLKAIADNKDQRPDFASLLPLNVFECDVDTPPEELSMFCSEADFVFNFAGVNRPDNPTEYVAGNCGFVSKLIQMLEQHGNCCPIVFASSIQASLVGRYKESAYGESKLAGELLVREYSSRTGAPSFIYRFPNLYGKWCRPHYNSVVATFCDAIANNKQYSVADPSIELDLLYIDDLVQEMLSVLLGKEHRCGYKGLEKVSGDDFCYVPGTDKVTLGKIVSLLKLFATSRETLQIPPLLEGTFEKKLYSTFLSYYASGGLSYNLTSHVDDRGAFTEFLRTPDRGQVSINVLHPGVTKGNHWHHSKWEKFLVVSGLASVKMRRLGCDQNKQPYPIDEYIVSGNRLTVVETAPGMVHSITNLSESNDLVMIIWANEAFDLDNPDTYYEEV